MRYEKGLVKEYKDYWHGQSIFEGEYLNGPRHGKGKKYYYKSGKVQLKVNIYIIKKWKVNFMWMINWYMKVNIYIIKNWMKKDMMKMVILFID